MDFKIEQNKCRKNNLLFNNVKFREHYKLRTAIYGQTTNSTSEDNSLKTSMTKK